MPEPTKRSNSRKGKVCCVWERCYKDGGSRKLFKVPSSDATKLHHNHTCTRFVLEQHLDHQSTRLWTITGGWYDFLS